MAVKYSGILRFTDEIKAGIDLAADGTVEKAVIIDGEGAETPIGGGGTSDFTTAEVTITNNTGSNIELALPEVIDGRRPHLGVSITAVANSSDLHIVPIYKGKTQGRFITDNVPSAVCTGGVTIFEGSGITITGDGTITFGTAS